MLRIMFESIARLARIPVVAICCIMISSLLACSPAVGDTKEAKACGPFGSPPAQEISAVAVCGRLDHSD